MNSLTRTTPASRATAAPVRHVEHCMGTVFSLHVCAPGIDRATLDRAITWLHRMDAMFSTYRAESEISLINAGRLTVDAASPEVRYVLADCEVFRDVTDGYFDARPDGVHLDPSGYVKGWAVHTVSEMLSAAGSTNHYVNGGGDVMCVGQPDPGRSWRIGVSDPRDREKFLRVVEASGPTAVAGSGPAERGSHIIDPHTGRPASGVASATVVAADLVAADVYATAAVAMGPDRAPEWLRHLTGLQAVLLTDDGRVVDINV